MTPGRCGSGSVAGWEPAANTWGGGSCHRDRLFCAPDGSVRSAQALCTSRSARGRDMADRSGATGRGGDRAESHPVLRHRLSVVHRGDPVPGWPARGWLFRDRVPGQRPACSWLLSVAAAVSAGLFAAASRPSGSPGQDTLALGRDATGLLVNVYSMRMAAVFTRPR